MYKQLLIRWTDPDAQLSVPTHIFFGMMVWILRKMAFPCCFLLLVQGRDFAARSLKVWIILILAPHHKCGTFLWLKTSKREATLRMCSSLLYPTHITPWKSLKENPWMEQCILPTKLSSPYLFKAPFIPPDRPANKQYGSTRSSEYSKAAIRILRIWKAFKRTGNLLPTFLYAVNWQVPCTKSLYNFNITKPVYPDSKIARRRDSNF